MVFDKFRDRLEKAKGFAKEAKEESGTNDFQEGAQICYVHDFNMFESERDGSLQLRLDIRGGDPDFNQECRSNQYYRIVTDDEAMVDPDAKKQGYHIIRFLESLGYEYDPLKLEDIIPAITMKKFKANIRLNKSNTTGKTYVNIYPVAFLKEEPEDSKDDVETPF